MQVQSNPNVLLTLILSVCVVALLIGPVGLILLVRGIRGRRVGTKPHCRACDYLLVGIESDRCPECGKPLNSETIVKGQRTSQPWMAGVGGMLVMFGLIGTALIATVAARTINWYQSIPAYFVMRDFRVPATRLKALTEMDRRDRIAPIGTEYRDEIVQAALTAQAAPTLAPDIAMLLDFAARQELAGRLSDSQRKLLFQQSLLTSLDVRQRVAVGDPLPYRINNSARTPPGWYVKLTGIDAWFNDQANAIASGGSIGYSAIGTGGSSSSAIPSPPVGNHELKVGFQVELFPTTNPTPSAPPVPSVFKESRELKAKFSVLPADSIAAVVLKRDTTPDHSLRRAVENAIHVESLRWERYGNRHLEGAFLIDALPIGIAFDVVASFNGGEYALGTITRAKSEAGSSRTSLAARETLNSAPPEKMNLIFRPSAKLAKGTIDLEEIFGDEIVINDVTVNVSAGSVGPSIRNSR